MPQLLTAVHQLFTVPTVPPRHILASPVWRQGRLIGYTHLTWHWLQPVLDMPVCYAGCAAVLIISVPVLSMAMAQVFMGHDLCEVAAVS